MITPHDIYVGGVCLCIGFWLGVAKVHFDRWMIERNVEKLMEKIKEGSISHGNG